MHQRGRWARGARPEAGKPKRRLVKESRGTWWKTRLAQRQGRWREADQTAIVETEENRHCV